ncbi:MAG TPA: amidohydrolase family protein [Micromonosporaceae bacterium]|nr:amidohydrolase family protein [Micromonosporaceae bacterium]
MSAVQLALCGGTVVTSLDPVTVVDADVVIAGDRIVSVGPAPAGAVRRDCSRALVLPGNVCAHHHLYSALSRGMPYRLAPPRSFLEVLQRVWWRLDRALDEPSVRLSALVGGLDALHAGTTTVIDHHASPNFIDGSLDVIADALDELGLRSVLCYEVTDRDGPARAAAGVAENARFLATPYRLARGMVGAHASFTLCDDTLGACAQAAADAGVGVHIHVAEDGVDQQDAQAIHGVRVVERLGRAGVLGPGAVLAHCVHVTGPEVEQVASSGAVVAHNPRSNMNNRVGYPTAAIDGARARAGVRVALGTDGIGGDMVTESQVGYFRATEATGPVDTGWPLRRLAEGARTAGRSFGEPLHGTLQPGAPADLTVLTYPSPTPLTGENLAGHWLFGVSPRQVRDVVVAGELVVADGRSTRIDEAELARRAAGEVKRLWARLEEIPPHQFTPKGR